MTAQYDPTWVMIGISILSAVFGAGGFFVGAGIKNANLDKKIDHIDGVKQSKLVCNERFESVQRTLASISDDVKWLRERNGGR